jgi:uncharacterized protein (TIGR00369 family)
MDKKEFMENAERAFDKREIRPEGLLMFHLLNLTFSYDDEKKTCRIECPISEVMLNPIGVVHGGIYTYIADTAMGHLNFRYKQASYVSLELKTSYLKATNTGKIRASARFVKEGHNVVFAECTIENEAGEVMCITTGTFYRYEKKTRE